MSQTGERLPERIEAVVTPLLAARDYELVLLEFLPRARILRLFIDHPRGVTLEDCTAVSRLVGDLLDAEGYSDLIRERYTLEVSSPGLDRPLVRPAHFQKFVGREVQVKTRQPLGGRRRFRGRLTAADTAGIHVDCEGQTCAIGYEAIESARLVPEL